MRVGCDVRRCAAPRPRERSSGDRRAAARWRRAAASITKAGTGVISPDLALARVPNVAFAAKPTASTASRRQCCADHARQAAGGRPARSRRDVCSPGRGAEMGAAEPSPRTRLLVPPKRAGRGAGGEARAPPPLPTPWVDRQGNPGSRGSYPSSSSQPREYNLLFAIRVEDRDQPPHRPLPPISTAAGNCASSSPAETRSCPAATRPVNTSCHPPRVGKTISVSAQSAV